MRNLFYFVFCICFIVFDVQATEISFSSTNGVTQTTTKAEKAILYNFSDDLINATSNCIPYFEDFSKSNPNVNNSGKMFGGAKVKVLIDIKGMEGDFCKFDVTHNIYGISNTKQVCSVDKFVLNEIIEAMKNRSTELVTKTFTTQNKMTIDGITKQYPQQNTMTDTVFNVTMAEIYGNYCELEIYEPSEQEQNDAAEKAMEFSDSFISSLNSCTQDREELSFLMFSHHYAEIIGKKDYLCHVRTNDFDFYIPEDIIPTLTDFRKLYELVSDKNIATYRKIENYMFDNIYSYVNKCQHSNYTTSSSGGFDENIYSVTRSISSSYKNNECALKLKNTLKIKDEKFDYSLICTISDEDRNAIISKYSGLLSNNTEKEELIKVGKFILKSLLKNKLCKFDN